MVVIAVVLLPHRVDERTVMFSFDKKFLRDAGELCSAMSGATIGCAFVNLDVFGFARWIAAL
jgi:hypothetical protein